MFTMTVQQAAKILRTAATLMCAAMIGLSGCGKSGPELHPVAGSVSFDGQPVAEGDIVLSDPQKQLAPAAGKIVGGHFQLASLAGPKKVEIIAYRVVGEEYNEMMQMKVQQRQQYIPERYNTRITLTIQVAAGPNKVDLPLKSK